MGQIQGSFQQQQMKEFCEKYKIDLVHFQKQIKYLNSLRYQFVGILGNGYYGCVIQAHSQTYNSVAIKIINSKTPNLENGIKQAIKFKKIQDPKHLVQVHDVVSNPSLNSYFIVSELTDCSLKEILQHNKLSERQIYELTLQLLEGLVEMQTFGISHLDIKSENILYSRPKNKFMYSDFGLATLFQKQTKPTSIKANEYERTSIYAAPELGFSSPTNSNQSKKMDIYSLGILLAETIIGKSFELEETEDIKENNNIQEYLPYESNLTEYFETILQNMVTPSANERQDASKLIEALKEKFQFAEQDLMGIYVKEISKLLQNQQMINKEYQTYYQKYFSQRGQSVININESRMKLNDSELQGVIDAVKLCENITELQLYFYVNQITDQGLSTVSSLINDNQQSLEILYLNFEENSIRDRGFLQLSQAIKQCKKLRKLELYFSRNKITDNGLAGLVSIFQQGQPLQELKLYFSENQISGNSVIDVAKEISNLKKLTNLTLFYSDIYLREEEFQGLTDVLKEYKYINVLKLCFSRNQLTGNGFKGLTEMFKDNPQLQNLELYFSQNKIDDHSLINVIESLKQCPKLQSIELYFSSNNITDHGCIGTADSLRKCSNLKDIYLDFMENEIQEKQRIQQIFDGNFKGKINQFTLDI